MPKIAYEPDTMRASTREVALQARAICEQYRAAGYSLTLRQLYYRFVANGLIENTQKSYKRLGSIVNDARMCGIIDWNHLEDRTRDIEKRGQWDHPRDIIAAVAEQFHTDYWAQNDTHVEVWVEKEALADVVQQATWPYDVTSLACRGYMSQSEQWTAARRFLTYLYSGKRIVVIHLGDHDPSGIDMSRDNEERLRKFLEHDYGCELDWRFEFRRIALTMDQVRQYNPPPNPAKVTDSRFVQYELEYGDESWELDALPPEVLTSLINDNLAEFMSADELAAAVAREDEYKRRIGLLLEEHGAVLDIDTETGSDDADNDWQG